ncbi:MAG TPA: DUF262 domain-containing protein [Candidatus Angelobacter sp.]|nr:DUF262 domain-containing protein [Candidatus Angelobacter sp.]
MAVDFFTTEKRTLGVVLSNTTPPLRVPEYQRDFSWEEKQISEFWNDLEHFDQLYPGNNISGKEYFLGAAVFVNNQTYNLILDGQQRIATATILLAAIRDKIREYRENAANQIQNSFISFQDHLTGEQLPKLQLNEFDRAFFRDSIQGFPPNPAAATKKSHKLILKAYKYFAERIQEGWNTLGGGENAFKWVARVSKTLTDHVSLVTVVSTDEDNAASIFETLNDRGIGLSTADLLRSWLLHHSPPGQRPEIIECWSDVFDSAGSGDGAQTLIRLSWVSRHGDVKERSLYKVISRNIAENHTPPVEFSRLLRSDALFYKRVRDGDTADIKEHDLWLSIATLRAQSGYAVLLAANRTLTDEARRRVSAALFALIVRHNVISDKDRAKFESTAFAAAKTLSDGGGEQAALAVLRALSPSDDDVRQSFSTLSFGRAQTGIAQVILRALEYKLRETEELIIATPEKVHIEHIYPQKPLPATRLAQHDEYVGRIGNLTLLDRRLNQEAQNAAFLTKRDEFYAHSEIYLTEELLDKAAWTPAEIDERQNHLCDLAIQIWPHNLVVD